MEHDDHVEGWEAASCVEGSEVGGKGGFGGGRSEGRGRVIDVPEGHFDGGWLSES